MPTSTTGYTMVKASTPFINGSALWHIILVSVAAGAGLAVAFGLILLGSEWAQKKNPSGERTGGWILGILAAAFCVAAIVAGIYIMVHPKGSAANKVVKSSLVTPHRTVA